jgi:hypothetical protein
VPWETTEERSFTRASILAALRKTIAEGKPVVGAGSSVGIVARSAEAGGADLIIVYSTGKTRIWGLPTTPLLHSNPVTLSMYDEIDNVVDHTPIIGGAHAGDPTYRRLPRLVRAFRDKGFDGIINFPSAGVDPARAAMREHVGQGLRRRPGRPHRLDRGRRQRPAGRAVAGALGRARPGVHRDHPAGEPRLHLPGARGQHRHARGHHLSLRAFGRPGVRGRVQHRAHTDRARGQADRDGLQEPEAPVIATANHPARFMPCRGHES